VNCGGSTPVCCYAPHSFQASSCSTAEACQAEPGSLQLCIANADCPTGQTCQPTAFPSQPAGQPGGFTACYPGVAIACGSTQCNTAQGCCLNSATPTCGAPDCGMGLTFSCTGNVNCGGSTPICCYTPHTYQAASCSTAEACQVEAGSLQLCTANADCPTGQTCQPTALPAQTAGQSGGFTACLPGGTPASVICGSMKCDSGQVCCVSASGATKCAASCESTGCPSATIQDSGPDVGLVSVTTTLPPPGPGPVEVDAAIVNVSADATEGDGGEAGCPSLVVNGDFAMGNAGFMSGYNYVAPAAMIDTEGQYTVGPNPSTVSVYPDWLMINPPSGPGNMLIANGSPNPNTSIWTQTIPVHPQTAYTFSYWMTCVDADCLSLPTLQASVNMASVGPMFTAAVQGGTWTQYTTTWS
jgi:Cys-rich repeat protein